MTSKEDLKKAAARINAEIIDGIAPYNYGNPEDDIAQIIELHTNLSGLEAAVKELVEAMEEYRTARRKYSDGLLTDHELSKSLSRVAAALANAKKVMEK